MMNPSGSGSKIIEKAGHIYVKIVLDPKHCLEEKKQRDSS
jgi:hypothetical protein